MIIKKYVEDNFLSSTFKIRYSTIKEDKLATNHPDFYQILLQKTSYLKSDNITERLYHVYNELDDNVICAKEGCYNIPKFQNFKDGYRGSCSNSCSGKHSSKKVHQTKIQNGAYKDIVKKQQETMFKGLA